MHLCPNSEYVRPRTFCASSPGASRSNSRFRQVVCVRDVAVRDQKILVATILSALLLFLPLPLYAQDGGKKPIRAVGAMGLASVVETMARAHAERAPQCPTVVVSGSTTEKGFESLMEGNAELVFAHREASVGETRKAEEKDVALEYKFLRKSGLAIVTSTNNTLNNLTMHQLGKIFSGEVTNWREIGGPDRPISVLMLKPDSGPSLLFRQRVLGGAPFAKDAVVLPSLRHIVDTCSKPDEKVYISYIPVTSAYFQGALEKGVSLIGINKDEHSPPIIPSAESLRDASYPITVSALLYWNAKSANSCLRDFAQFCAEMSSKAE
jgi:phosphate transport system substrate-binding protein